MAFFLVWFVLDLAGSHWSDNVTIDRDYGSGLRLESLLLATGVTFGSAVTGDWVSTSVTSRDFIVRSWPIVPVSCLALLAERPLRRSAKAFQGRFAATAYAVLSIIFVAVERRMR